MGKPKIVIAIPTGRPLKDGKLPKRAMHLAQAFGALVPDFEILVSHSACPREAHAVNLLIEQFRNDPKAEWFVWWNLHVDLEAAQLLALFLAKKPIIGALFTSAEDEPHWEAAFYPDVLPEENGALAVPELGPGVKIFHRSIFDVIEKADPELTYIYDNSGRSCTAFCGEQLAVFGDYRRLLSPANHLDLLCRKSNIGIYAHSGVVLTHRGPDGTAYPLKPLYRPWLFKREPPPVCVEDLAEGERDARPIAVCLQFCDKDRNQANRLEVWIHNSTNRRPKMIYSAGAEYPKAPNDTALELLRASWVGYKAVLLLEPDCCPLTADWLDQLSADWDKVQAAGKLIMGSWHPLNNDHPTLGHLNGNLMFAPDLSLHITIPEVPDDKPWDTYLADVFAPVWCRTGLIKNLNRHKTATTKQLSTPECGTRAPILIHGVKDDSAWKYAETLCATKSSSLATGVTSSG